MERCEGGGFFYVPTTPKKMSVFIWTDSRNTRALIQSYILSDAYPVQAIWNLFSCFNHIGPNREFAFFHISTDKTTEFVNRRNSFKSLEDFQRVIRNDPPFRIEIGPIRISPLHAKQELPSVVASEFRIDIDVDGYDGARSCCRGKKFCPSCWPLVTLAAQQINLALEMLGSTTHVWFYSGGRGMHCWDFTRSDPIFMDSAKSTRSQIAIYLCQCDVSLAAGLQHNPLCLARIRLLLLDKNHSFLIWYLARHPYIALTTISRCASILLAKSHTKMQKEDISTVIFSNKVIDAAESIQNVRLSKLRELRGMDVDTSIEDLPSLNEDSIMCIRVVVMQMIAKVKSIMNAPTSIDWSISAVAAIAEAALICMGPRIDLQVSTSASHLLRAPMGIHAATGHLGIMVADTNLPGFYPKAGETVPVLVGANGELHPRELSLKCKKEFIDWVNEQKNLLV